MAAVTARDRRDGRHRGWPTCAGASSGQAAIPTSIRIVAVTKGFGARDRRGRPGGRLARRGRELRPGARRQGRGHDRHRCVGTSSGRSSATRSSAWLPWSAPGTASTGPWPPTRWPRPAPGVEVLGAGQRDRRGRAGRGAAPKRSTLSSSTAASARCRLTGLMTVGPAGDLERARELLRLAGPPSPPAGAPRAVDGHERRLRGGRRRGRHHPPAGTCSFRSPPEAADRATIGLGVSVGGS